ncbi:MAG: very short patch repair endonuclease [Euryarchaeota archaeon]|nr:very short patch repair endonuclease [Euryarchaeota archaeon]|tara:strand:- start:171 stop:614 length:444 start_codon:yes stop_codon:yes gene_type:complete
MAIEAPKASSIAVHNVMVANKSTNTKPELLARQMLRENGFPGYRLHWRIDDRGGGYLCRPDIAFPGRRFAVFVHGCFWHRCPTCDLSLPKSNIEYWNQKFDRNIERDSRKERSLVGLGWRVLTIWECRIAEGVEEAVEILSETRNRP